MAAVASRRQRMPSKGAALPFSPVAGETSSRVPTHEDPIPWRSLPHATQLNIAGRHVRDASSIAKALRSGRALTTVVLEWNAIGRASLSDQRAVLAAIAAAPALTTLDLRNNSLGPDFGQEFARIIRRHASLIRVDLRWNSLGPEACASIAEAIRDHNSRIVSLKLSGNIAREESLIVVEASCRRNAARLPLAPARGVADVVGSTLSSERAEAAVAADLSARVDRLLADRDAARARANEAEEALQQHRAAMERMERDLQAEKSLSAMLAAQVEESRQRLGEEDARCEDRIARAAADSAKTLEAIEKQLIHAQQQLSMKSTEAAEAVRGEAACRAGMRSAESAQEAAEAALATMKARVAAAEADAAAARREGRERASRAAAEAAETVDVANRRTATARANASEASEAAADRIAAAEVCRREAERRADVLRDQLERERTRHAEAEARMEAGQGERWREAVRALREETDERLRAAEAARAEGASTLDSLREEARHRADTAAATRSTLEAAAQRAEDRASRAQGIAEEANRRVEAMKAANKRAEQAAQRRVEAAEAAVSNATAETERMHRAKLAAERRLADSTESRAGAMRTALERAAEAERRAEAAEEELNRLRALSARAKAELHSVSERLHGAAIGEAVATWSSYKGHSTTTTSRPRSADRHSRSTRGREGSSASAKNGGGGYRSKKPNPVISPESSDARRAQEEEELGIRDEDGDDHRHYQDEDDGQDREHGEVAELQAPTFTTPVADRRDGRVRWEDEREGDAGEHSAEVGEQSLADRMPATPSSTTRHDATGTSLEDTTFPAHDNTAAASAASRGSALAGATPTSSPDSHDHDDHEHDHDEPKSQAGWVPAIPQSCILPEATGISAHEAVELRHATWTILHDLTAQSQAMPTFGDLRNQSMQRLEQPVDMSLSEQRQWYRESVKAMVSAMSEAQAQREAQAQHGDGEGPFDGHEQEAEGIVDEPDIEF